MNCDARVAILSSGVKTFEDFATNDVISKQIEGYAFSFEVRAREEEQHEAAPVHLHHRESQPNYRDQSL